MTKSLVNQVCVKFDLYDKIKEAQQRVDQITKIAERIQRGETQDFIIEKSLLKKRNRICTTLP